MRQQVHCPRCDIGADRRLCKAGLDGATRHRIWVDHEVGTAEPSLDGHLANARDDEQGFIAGISHHRPNASSEPDGG